MRYLAERARKQRDAILSGETKRVTVTESELRAILAKRENRKRPGRRQLDQLSIAKALGSSSITVDGVTYEIQWEAQ